MDFREQSISLRPNRFIKLQTTTSTKNISLKIVMRVGAEDCIEPSGRRSHVSLRRFGINELLFPFQSGADQFVELKAEIDYDEWDFRFSADRINRDLEKNPLSPPSIFHTNYTVRCVVGTNAWLIERNYSNEKQTYWFTGTNIIWLSVAAKETPRSPRVGERFTWTKESSDGNPGHPGGVADLMGFDLPGRISWLAFCSSSFLKRDGRQIFPPSQWWKESSLVYSGWSDQTTVFQDGLGLPRILDLIATNNQPIFQYQTRQSTNVLGWNFPLEFYCVQYLPADQGQRHCSRLGN